MARKLNCITWIKPVGLENLVGSDEIPYSTLLKKLWAYWKSNKLYRIERLHKA